MKKTLLSALLVVAACVPALAANPPPPPPQKILLIDRQAILRFSKVGQDVARQIETMGNQAKGEIAGQQKALQAEAQQLQQQIAILAADAKAKKVQAFEAKQAGMQAAAQRKEQAIQGGFMTAQSSPRGRLSARSVTSAHRHLTAADALAFTAVGGLDRPVMDALGACRRDLDLGGLGGGWLGLRGCCPRHGSLTFAGDGTLSWVQPPSPSSVRGGTPASEAGAVPASGFGSCSAAHQRSNLLVLKKCKSESIPSEGGSGTPTLTGFAGWAVSEASAYTRRTPGSSPAG